MKKLILVLFIGIMTVQGYAQKQYLKNGVALQGYDPVAYFESNKAVQGDSEINTKHNRALYFFSSEKNKALFLKTPEKYAPQYGGFCAYGVSENHLSPADPQAFTIVDNKLYLNYNLEVRKMWAKDRETCIKKANDNWTNLNKK